MKMCISSYVCTDTCKHIIYYWDLLFFTRIFVNDENEAFFCAFHSQNPKGLSKPYIRTRDTGLALTKTNELSPLSSRIGKLAFCLMIFNSYAALAILIF